MSSIKSLINVKIPARNEKYTFKDLFIPHCYDVIKSLGLKSEQECYCLIAHLLEEKQNRDIVIGYGGCINKLKSLCSLCTAPGSKPEVSAYYCATEDSKKGKVSMSNCTPSTKIETECEVCKNLCSRIRFVKKSYQLQVNTSCDGIIVSVFEHHSGTDANAFEATIRQAIYIGVDILRLFLSYDDETNVVKCYTVYYFPNNSKSSCVVAITITFNILFLRFDCRCDILEKENVSTHVQTVVNKQVQICKFLLGAKENMFYLNTILRVDQGEMKQALLNAFGSDSYFKKWNNLNILQYQSSSSFVFFLFSDDNDDQQVFAKWRVHKHDAIDAVYKHSDIKQRLTKSSQNFPSPIYDYLATLMVCSRPFVIYPRLLGPLSRSDVKQCFESFLYHAATALRDLHSLGCAHRDVRLENICFDINPFRAVLIDIDTVCTVEDESTCSSDNKEAAKQSCLYVEHFTFKMTDWRQLGCMAIWVLLQDAECLKNVTTIHDMKVDTILACLEFRAITKSVMISNLVIGKLYFINT